MMLHGLRNVASRLRPQAKTPGTEPGTLIYEGEKPVKPVRMHVYDYGPDSFAEREIEDVGELESYRGGASTTWIDVDGVHDISIVDGIGRAFDIHPLTLEDVVSTDQRPKVEEYPNYIYAVVQMMHYDHESVGLTTEQISLLLMDGVVISFQESIEGDVFDPIRRRLREGRGRIRSGGADYLAYALIDVIVDYYMVVLEGLGEHIESVEDAILSGTSPEIMHRVTTLRRKVTHMRRTIWPLRDAVLALQRSQQPFMSVENEVFYRDVYDHAVRTIEIIESSRDVLATITDLHVSTLSFRMNEIMKVLAIIATFFLPLTFIAGVYGMNFNTGVSPLNMPELEWYFGYPFSLGLMLLVAIGMFIYFRRRGWL